MKKDFYSVTREEAAAGLGVSTRTIDRYVKSKKLRSKFSPSRQVLIHTKDLEKLGGNVKAAKKSAQPKKSKPVEATAEPIEVANESVEEKVFRDLYEEASKDLKSKQEKLEAASFRVGQLEAQLKSSVPLLEHKQKEQAMLGENARLKEKLVASILKSWVFLGIAGLAATIAAILAFLNYF